MPTSSHASRPHDIKSLRLLVPNKNDYISHEPVSQVRCCFRLVLCFVAAQLILFHAIIGSAMAQTFQSSHQVNRKSKRTMW